jgi:hypothetical protein
MTSPASVSEPLVCRSKAYGRLLIHHWDDAPNPTSIRRVEAETRRAFVTQGAKVLMLVVISARRLPNREARAAMKELSRTLHETTEGIWVVIERDGVIGIMLKTILDGMAIIMKLGAGFTHYRASGAEALSEMGRMINVPPEPLVADARINRLIR